MTDDRAIIAQIRQTIPTCNLKVFDAEAADLLKWLKAQPESREVYTGMFWTNVQTLKARDVSKAPPCLVQYGGETADEYLARCYKAGGYKTV